ncbi:MAG TPA: Bax inhibitor-1/YccA family protein [Candidatus Limnocylindrales bacterium]|nr:Bax inhibitor-1/YccA family protein [Candidatus Limnocylindrales bacterium]
MPIEGTVEASSTYLSHAFVWMFAGLLLTAAVAFLVQGSERVMQLAVDALLPIVIGQLALVIVISWAIRRISATVALGLFFVYAASMGLTIGLIVTAYNGQSVVAAFLTAAGMFGGAALYGVTTKRSLAGIGGFLIMALIGLIVASVVNIFLASSAFGWALSVVGVVIFTALTAYHVQMIQRGALVLGTGSVEKAAVLGALSLYLDFVNLFLMLLRLFGGGRR